VGLARGALVGADGILISYRLTDLQIKEKKKKKQLYSK